jgi:hypothetical protein
MRDSIDALDSFDLGIVVARNRVLKRGVYYRKTRYRLGGQYRMGGGPSRSEGL